MGPSRAGFLSFRDSCTIFKCQSLLVPSDTRGRVHMIFGSMLGSSKRPTLQDLSVQLPPCRHISVYSDVSTAITPHATVKRQTNESVLRHVPEDASCSPAAGHLSRRMKKSRKQLMTHLRLLCESLLDQKQDAPVTFSRTKNVVTPWCS